VSNTKSLTQEIEMAHRHAPAVKHDAPGMTGERSRNENGQLRQKRGDTHAETIEQQYGVDLGVRGDKHLRTILRDESLTSLDELLNKK
jgi:hypothetical protein